MPEPYWPKRKGAYTLSDAAKVGNRLARIRCRYCKLVRYYRLDDLKAVFGDIECDDVPYQMRCSQCRGHRTLEMELEDPPAEKRQGLIIRRVERIYYVRRVVWRDEGPGS
ncbi:MAG: hypothetical protein E5Y06_10565 [Mesorhizobium sp.]|uniref:hypothetical protein n=1 Tax=Mesorhizobium sp. TaxID=1871066 RepID=UPI00122255B0|nr:hypothetical protein [Mesorhizobium sp.]TIN95690.1 MAG: hypothetical protein E5Y06_10565 [Mesorhizobium sp.]TJU98491.1 MAG: hypothetical protein E5Y08_13455 [Mesorhizobium sp.]